MTLNLRGPSSATYAAGVTVNAVANGTTDVASAIQSALDLAATLGGANVVLPPKTGVYTIGSTLYLPANVTLTAHGATVKALAGCGHLLRAKGQQTAVFAPIGPTATPSASGGTLAAGTKAYKVTAVTASGETIPTPEAYAVTTGSTGKVTLSWTAPVVRSGAPAITGYRVYGRTSGSLSLLLGTTAAGVTTFDDTGMAGSAATPPTTNGTLSRTANIRVLGGTWDLDASGVNPTSQAGSGIWTEGRYNGHAFDFQKVDGLRLTDLTVKNASKWAIAVADFTDLVTTGIRFATQSDGIHVLGPGDRWVADDISGTVGDDMVGISTVEWPTYAVSEGTIGEVVVSNLNAASAFSVIRALGGTGTKIGSLTVKHVRGACAASPAAAVIYANNDQNNPGRAGTVIDHVLIDDVDVTPPTSNITVNLTGTYKTITLKRVQAYGATGYGVAMDTVTADLFRGEGLRGSGGNQQRLVSLANAGSNIKQMSITDSGAFDNTFTGSWVAYLTGGNIGRLHLARCTLLVGNGQAPAIAYIAGGVPVGTIDAEDCELISTGSVGCIVASDDTTSNVPTINVRASRCTGQALVKIKGVSSLRMRDIVSACSAAVTMFGAPATLTIQGAEAWTLTSGAAVSRDATQTIVSQTLGFRGDVSILARNNGDMAYNTNAALSCGVGPVVCNGTSWKHVYTDATY